MNEITFSLESVMSLCAFGTVLTLCWQQGYFDTEVNLQLQSSSSFKMYLNKQNKPPLNMDNYEQLQTEGLTCNNLFDLDTPTCS